VRMVKKQVEERVEWSGVEANKTISLPGVPSDSGVL
jgi:hypothetical protein